MGGVVKAPSGDSGSTGALNPFRSKAYTAPLSGAPGSVSGSARAASPLEVVALGGAKDGRYYGLDGSMKLDPRDPNRREFAIGAGGTTLSRISLALAGEGSVISPYRENPVVRASIKAFSEGFARLDFGLWSADPTEDAGGEARRAPASNPLEQLLASPNRALPGSELWSRMATIYKLDGEAYWFLANALGQPVKTTGTGQLLEAPASFILARGRHTQVEYDGLGLPVRYRYSVSGQASQAGVPWPWDAVVPFIDYDPDDECRGFGDVNAAIRPIDIQHQVIRYLDAILRNGGDPGGFVVDKQQVMPEELERRSEILNEKFGSSELRKWAALGGDVSVILNPHSPKDMDFVEGWDRMTLAICIALGVPPPCIGIYESATYNNLQGAYRQLWCGANGILALASYFARTVRTTLLPRLRGVRGWESIAGLYPYFDPSAIEELREDKLEHVKIAVSVAQAGIGLSVADGLEMLGADIEAPDAAKRRLVSPAFIDIETGEGFGPQDAPDEEADDESNEEDAGARKQSLSAADSAPLGPADGAPDDPEARAYAAPGSSPAFPVFHRAALAWISQYERATLANLRAIAAGSDPIKVRDYPKSVAASAGGEGDRTYKGVLDSAADIESMTDAEFNALLLDSFAWASKFDKATRQTFRSIFIQAALEAQGVVGGGILTSSSPRTIQFVAGRLAKVSEGVTSTLARDVREALAKALSGVEQTILVDGVPQRITLRSAIKESLPELTENLQRVFGSKEARAATIANTEGGIATNGGIYAQFEEAGVEEIEWHSRDDEATRPTHAALHGKRIKLGQRFANGLRYPLDPEGAPGEIINCRCEPLATKYKRQ